MVANPDQQKIVPVDEQRIAKVFEELGNMGVELERDPLAFGPKRLNHKIAEARLHLSRCERIFTHLSQELFQQQRHHRNLKLRFEIQKADLFVNDPEVRAGRNIADREAAAQTKLRNLHDSIFVLESNLHDLETTLKIVRAKRTDLKDIQGRLRDQFKVCLEEISLGARWGSRLPGSNNPPELEPGQGYANASDAEEIDDLIEGMEKAETQLPQKEIEYPPIGKEVEKITPEETGSLEEKLTSTNLPSGDLDLILSEIDDEEEIELENPVDAPDVDIDSLLDNFEG
jgi:hypothetical protein